MLEKLWIRLCIGALAATTSAGCVVPEKRYDDTVRTLQAEQAAHRATAQRVYEIEQQLATVQGLLNEAKKRLDSREQDLARTSLDVDVAATERKDAVRMVDQLRDELARAGDHLRAFADQKKRLEEALEDAKQQSQSLEHAESGLTTKILLMRDVTRALGDAAQSGAEIDSRGGDIVVRFQSSRLFEQKTARLSASGAASIQRFAAAIAPIARARVAITEASADADTRPESIVVRLQTLADALSGGGVAFERVTSVLPPEPTAPVPDAPVDTVTETEPGKAPAATATQPDDKAPAAEPVAAKPGTVELVVSLAPPPSA